MSDCMQSAHLGIQSVRQMLAVSRCCFCALLALRGHVDIRISVVKVVPAGAGEDGHPRGAWSKHTLKAPSGTHSKTWVRLCRNSLCDVDGLSAGALGVTVVSNGLSASGARGYPSYPKKRLVRTRAEKAAAEQLGG